MNAGPVVLCQHRVSIFVSDMIDGSPLDGSIWMVASLCLISMV